MNARWVPGHERRNHIGSAPDPLTFSSFLQKTGDLQVFQSAGSRFVLGQVAFPSMSEQRERITVLAGDGSLLDNRHDWLYPFYMKGANAWSHTHTSRLRGCRQQRCVVAEAVFFPHHASSLLCASSGSLGAFFDAFWHTESIHGCTSPLLPLRLYYQCQHST